MLGDHLFWLRIAVFLPLVVIAIQVILLRRLLNSRAWTFLVVGFVIFVLVRGVLFVTTPPSWSLLLATFAGYAFIMLGFHILRRDMLWLLQVTDTSKGVPLTKERP